MFLNITLLMVICSKAALIATEKHFGRDTEAEEEDPDDEETEEGTEAKKKKKNAERFISLPEFRVFLFLLSRYFSCCKVLQEKMIGMGNVHLNPNFFHIGFPSETKG